MSIPQIPSCLFLWHSYCIFSGALRYKERSTGNSTGLFWFQRWGRLARYHRSVGNDPGTWWQTCWAAFLDLYCGSAPQSDHHIHQNKIAVVFCRLLSPVFMKYLLKWGKFFRLLRLSLVILAFGFLLRQRLVCGDRIIHDVLFLLLEFF